MNEARSPRFSRGPLYFDDVFARVGEVTGDLLQRSRAAIVAILTELQARPENRSTYHSYRDGTKLFEVLMLDKGGLIRSLKARGKNVLISPLYFSDNADGLADLVAKAGSDDLKAVFDAIRANQGWPLSMIVERQAVSGRPLTPVQIELAQMLAQENMLKPPTIKVGDSEQPFLFTPMPGSARLSLTQRHIYERAMALLAAVRKGQLLPVQYSIYKPMALLCALRDRGHLNANSEAIGHYGKYAGVSARHFVQTVPEIRILSQCHRKTRGGGHSDWPPAGK